MSNIKSELPWERGHCPALTTSYTWLSPGSQPHQRDSHVSCTGSCQEAARARLQGVAGLGLFQMTAFESKSQAKAKPRKEMKEQLEEQRNPPVLWWGLLLL